MLLAGSKEVKSKFSADTSVKEAFLQVVLDTKLTDDNKLQALFIYIIYMYALNAVNETISEIQQKIYVVIKH